jgi:adenylosuccinate synthase
LSGVTRLVITKVDVLNAFDEIKVCTAYRINGKETTRMPFDLMSHEVQPVYQSFPGWSQSLDSATSYSELPEALRTYLDFLENALETPVTMVSLGPEREKLLLRPAGLAVEA